MKAYGAGPLDLLMTYMANPMRTVPGTRCALAASKVIRTARTFRRFWRTRHIRSRRLTESGNMSWSVRDMVWLIGHDRD